MNNWWSRNLNFEMVFQLFEVFKYVKTLFFQSWKQMLWLASVKMHHISKDSESSRSQNNKNFKKQIKRTDWRKEEVAYSNLRSPKDCCSCFFVPCTEILANKQVHWKRDLKAPKLQKSS